jgi:hypothetical protein
VILPSESTLQSAAPSVGAGDVARVTEQVMVLTGGTLLQLHPTRMGRSDVVIRGSHIVQVGGSVSASISTSPKTGPTPSTRSATNERSSTSASSGSASPGQGRSSPRPTTSPPDLVLQLARAGAFVATNPRSNMRHGLGLFGGSGDHVALGTDGIDGDILAEARAYALRHDEAKDGLGREAGARIAAGQVMTSRLFGDPTPPRIAPGARADLTILDYNPLTPMNQSNGIEHVVRGWSAEGVRHTIVGGRFVVRDRALVNVDERALVGRSRPAASRLWERMLGYY